MSHHMCSTGLTRRLHLSGVDVVALFAGDGAKTMFAMAVDALIGTTIMEAVMRVDGNLLADFRSVTRILEIRLKVDALPLWRWTLRCAKRDKPWRRAA